MSRLFPAALALALSASAALAQDNAAAFFLQVWDLDRDGTVTLTELERMRGNVFGRFDEDGNGVLDAAEYVPFDAARAEEAGDFAGAEADRMRTIAEGLSLARNDVDGDGAVSAAEFRAGAAGWLASLDSDGSATLTPGDFAAD